MRKWLLVRGVPGKLVPIGGERGNFYGMQRKSFPDGKLPAVFQARFEPCEMVVPWSRHADRAGRSRKRGDGAGNLVDARSLIILAKCSAPDRATAVSELAGKRPAAVAPTAAEAARKAAAAKQAAEAAKALKEAAKQAADAAKAAEKEAAHAKRVAEAVASVGAEA